MFKLTSDEIMIEVYAVLRKSPAGRGEDLAVAKVCALAVVDAESRKEKGVKLGDDVR